MIGYSNVKAVENISEKVLKSSGLKEKIDSMGESFIAVRRPRFIMGFVMQFAYFVIIVFMNLCSVGFNFSAFITLDFWVKTGMNVLLLIVGYQGMINILYGFQEKRPNVVKSREAYRIMNEKTNKSKLSEYLEKVYNIETKQEYYISKINKKIYKIKKKIFRTKSNKKWAKLENELTILKNLKEAKYIEDNLDDIKVKFPTVHASDFNEYEFNANVNGNKTRSDFNKAVNIKSLKGSFNLILYTIVFAMLVVNMVKDVDSTFWIGFIGTLMTQIIRMFNATMDMPGIYDSSITCTYDNRKAILDKYNLWLGKNPDLVYENIINKRLSEEREQIYLQAKTEAKSNIQAELSKNGINV